MGASKAGSVREIFEAVAALPPEARAAEVERLCGGDAALRERVGRLLAADDRASTFLEEPLLKRVGEGVPVEMGMAMVGQVIGRYRVKRLIGTGGMGAVYEAEQDRPRRLVALKVIRPGLVRRDLLRRFEYEAQALARLKHPGVAPIYEAGTHKDPATGLEWPYIAMELVVDAMPLTMHAERRGLGEQDRLGLFLEVCDAVHHAHQRGVIHRDLKPANILVDEAGRARVIDFGVARAADGDMSMSAGTGAGQLVGTLQYMSPEQCSAGSADVDTRSDVYSLGVVLYELVSGQMPYKLESVPALEAARLVREAAPARLRTKGVGEDLEAIIFKALEKDRERRYQSAAELRDDVGRFVRGESVHARPPTLGYQVRTFARRHRAIAIGGGMALVALFLGVVGTSAGLMKALRERDRSIELQRRSEEEATRAKRVAAFLRQVLASANPYDYRELSYYFLPESTMGERLEGDRALRHDGRSPPPSDVLKRAAAELMQRFPEDPLIRAELATNLGEALALSGWLNEAIELLRDAHRTLLREAGRDHLGTVRAAEWLAHSLEQFEPDDEIVALREYAYKTRSELQGPLHAETLRASAALVRALERGPDPAAAVVMQQQRCAEVERALGAESGAALDQRLALGSALSNKGDHDEAVRVTTEVYERSRDLSGQGAPRTMHARLVLSNVLMAAGRASEGEAHMRAGLVETARLLGSESPAQAGLEISLVFLLAERRAFREVVPLAQRQIEVCELVHGPTHHVAIKMKHMIANALLWLEQDLPRAEKLAREAMERIGEPTRTSRYRVTLARIVMEQGRLEEAERLLRTSVSEESTWVESARHATNTSIYHALACCLAGQGRGAESRESLERSKRELAAMDPRAVRFTEPNEEEMRIAEEAVARAEVR